VTLKKLNEVRGAKLNDLYLYQPEKLATDDVMDKFCDIIKDDTEVQAAPNAYENID
jgi:hypothetical protein